MKKKTTNFGKINASNSSENNATKILKFKLRKKLPKIDLNLPKIEIDEICAFSFC